MKFTVYNVCAGFVYSTMFIAFHVMLTVWVISLMPVKVIEVNVQPLVTNKYETITNTNPTEVHVKVVPVETTVKVDPITILVPVKEAPNTQPTPTPQPTPHKIIKISGAIKDAKRVGNNRAIQIDFTDSRSFQVDGISKGIVLTKNQWVDITLDTHNGLTIITDISPIK